MKLNYAQKKQMLEQGFVKVSGAVPQGMVNEALKAINHSLGSGMPEEMMPKFRAGSYCPELRNSPVLTDLVNRTPVLSLAESMVGEGRLKPARNAQIALRFPSKQDKPSQPRAHLDGMYSENNGVQAGTYNNFTMLVGVYLSDIPTEFAGNFTAWPGGHLKYERYFQENSTDILLTGMPPVDIGEPEQLTVKSGDIALCHYQLGHSAAINLSPNIRYALYFRLKHVDHDNEWKETYSDIWRHWPGIREIM